MALLAPITGDVLLLRYMVNFSQPADLELRLYTNNQTPSETDNLPNYTESTASNYSAIRLLGGSWTVSSGVSAGATATYAQQSFNFSAADTIYGYFVTSQLRRELCWAEKFQGGPFQIPAAGASIQLVPRVSLD